MPFRCRAVGVVSPEKECGGVLTVCQLLLRTSSRKLDVVLVELLSLDGHHCFCTSVVDDFLHAMRSCTPDEHREQRCRARLCAVLFRIESTLNIFPSTRAPTSITKWGPTGDVSLRSSLRPGSRETETRGGTASRGRLQGRTGVSIDCLSSHLLFVRCMKRLSMSPFSYLCVLSRAKPSL